MAEKAKKIKKLSEVEQLRQQVAEITSDLQRTRADYENHTKRSEIEKANAREYGETSAILKLLPVVDNIERAINHIPDELADNAWAQGIAGLAKNLDKSLESLNLKRIDATVGSPFNPDLHEAILVDEDTDGDHEVIATEMQAGYTLNGRPIRHSMVKVTRQ